MNVMHGNSKALKATASVSPGKLGSFRKNRGAGSHRFYLGGFRRRTPGPSPFLALHEAANCSVSARCGTALVPVEAGQFWQHAPDRLGGALRLVLPHRWQGGVDRAFRPDIKGLAANSS